ncbi:MAG TPA: hypothetical protein VGM70_06935 [Pseudolysinimonas sp.]|jgi:hypothetical protein
MVWSHLLLSAVIAVGLASAPNTATSGVCTVIELNAGLCNVDASVGSDEVTLVGSADTPGTTSGSGSNPSQGPSRTKARDDQCEIVVQNRCLTRKGRPGPDQPAVVVQPITLRDIAAFRPAPGRQLMEPNGWVVPGLDANFYSIVDQQLVNGTLLGQPATVRFTPVAWHWNYGDGSAVIRPTKGTTWAAQGLADFDQTPTSHIYEAEGQYVIRLSIDFHAEYRFGGSGFVPISGTINLPANDLHVTVTGAKTVLVEHDCAANPAGPGC